MIFTSKIFGILLIFGSLAVGFDNSVGDSKENILAELSKISMARLLEFEKIAKAIDEEFDKARFYNFIANEINTRMKEHDEKFYSSEATYLEEISKIEKDLILTPYKFTDDRPSFDYEHLSAEITYESIDDDIHHIQATLVKGQFKQVYEYYRKRLDNYKSYLGALRELKNCREIRNRDNQVQYFSDFPQLHRGVKLLIEASDDEGTLKVNRDVLGKVRYIDWQSKEDGKIKGRREYEYFNNGLLAKLTDRIESKVVFETIYGNNNIAEHFFDYLFSPGFIPHDYNFFTEIYYDGLSKPVAYKFVTHANHVIGTIYREYDEKDHLIKETWCKGETSKILREFSSIFDPATGDYKLIERDRTGNIVYQEIVLSSND